MDGWVERDWMDGWIMDGWMMDIGKDGLYYGWMNGLLDKVMDVWMDGWRDGCMKGWMEWWLDGRAVPASSLTSCRLLPKDQPYGSNRWVCGFVDECMSLMIAVSGQWRTHMGAHTRTHTHTHAHTRTHTQSHAHAHTQCRANWQAAVMSELLPCLVFNHLSSHPLHWSHSQLGTVSTGPYWLTLNVDVSMNLMLIMWFLAFPHWLFSFIWNIKNMTPPQNWYQYRTSIK